MAVRIILIVLAFAALADSSLAQDEKRASITIEAEIIPALGTGGSRATTVSGDQGAQGSFGTTLRQSVDGPPTAETVAASLLESAQTGDLSAADTALVARLQAGRRTYRQNPSALVTVTVIDEYGKVTNTTMRTTDFTADIFGLRTDASSVLMGSGFTGRSSSAAEALLGGDTMRRNLGERYFFVQVCSCDM